jgi:hypothetical protein
MAEQIKIECGDPRCTTCGLEITTGLMAVFCPRRQQCEFYPQEPELQEFVEELRSGVAA